jgi:hypothetical protein
MPFRVCHWKKLGRMVCVRLTMEQNHDQKIGLVVLHVVFMVGRENENS